MTTPTSSRWWDAAVTPTMAWLSAPVPALAHALAQPTLTPAARDAGLRELTQRLVLVGFSSSVASAMTQAATAAVAPLLVTDDGPPPPTDSAMADAVRSAEAFLAVPLARLAAMAEVHRRTVAQAARTAAAAARALADTAREGLALEEALQGVAMAAERAQVNGTPAPDLDAAFLALAPALRGAPTATRMRAVEMASQYVSREAVRALVRAMAPDAPRVRA